MIHRNLVLTWLGFFSPYMVQRFLALIWLGFFSLDTIHRILALISLGFFSLDMIYRILVLTWLGFLSLYMVQRFLALIWLGFFSLDMIHRIFSLDMAFYDNLTLLLDRFDLDFGANPTFATHDELFASINYNFTVIGLRFTHGIPWFTITRFMIRILMTAEFSVYWDQISNILIAKIYDFNAIRMFQFGCQQFSNRIAFFCITKLFKFSSSIIPTQSWPNSWVYNYIPNFLSIPPANFPIS